MKHVRIFFAIMILSQFFLAPIAFSQNTLSSVPSATNLNGTWRGTWYSPKGYVYFAEMHLDVSPDGIISGDIIWTMNNSPQDSDITKIGLKGTEYIRGTYNTQSRVLIFEGYRKDDPNIVIGLDKYRLILSDNNQVIGGITSNHGDWRGLFSLVRVLK
ncbi:MAG: hypothetical protein LLF28_00180 [Nitrospiraceae bacterium]|nr:hypothetical protein [Nitrospiraceae bacterium]